MAAFHERHLTATDSDGQQCERLDWSLMKYGPLAMFRKEAVLAEAIGWLETNGYTVAQADCGSCESEEEVLWAIGKSLGFHRWPYPNLDGFNDACRDLRVTEERGIVVVLRRFEQVARRFPDFARHILDIFAWRSWDNLLFGRRFICLVQSEDPWIEFGLVGGREPSWNRREWFNADRQ